MRNRETETEHTNEMQMKLFTFNAQIVFSFMLGDKMENSIVWSSIEQEEPAYQSSRKVAERRASTTTKIPCSAAQV